MAFRSSTTTGNDVLVSSISPAVPAGAQAGDIMIAQLYRWESINPAATAPSGFTALGSPQVSPAGTGAKIAYYWKLLTGADSGTYTWSWTGAMWTTAAVACFSGCTGTPVIVGQGTSTTTTPASVGGTLSAASDLLWALGSDTGASETPPTSPVAFTEQWDPTPTAGATRDNVSAGSITVSGATTSVADWTGTTLIALQRAAAAAAGPLVPISQYGGRF